MPAPPTTPITPQVGLAAGPSRWDKFADQWLRPAPLLLLAAVGFLGYREYHSGRSAGPDAAPAPIVVADKAAEDLGAAYARAIVAAPLAGLDAGANAGSATSTADVAQAQSDARRAAQLAAYQPIADEVGRRAGALSTKADPDAVQKSRAFLGSVAAGYRKGAGVK